MTTIKEFVKENRRTKSVPFVAGQTDIPVTVKQIDENDLVGLIDTVLAEWFTDGKEARHFSVELAKSVQKSDVILVNSGSSANLLAVSALFEKYPNRRKVISCATGFPTTINSVIQAGGELLIVDADKNTLNASMVQLMGSLHRDDVAGVILAHTLGFPFPEHIIRRTCREMGKWLIADCADALGSEVNGEHVGYDSDISTYSFYPAHTITSLEYNEPVILMNPFGEISIQKIGEFVTTRDFQGWKCISFDPEGNLSYQNITGTVEHPKKESEKLLKITVQTGRHSTVTQSHSVFTLDKNEITPVEASKLSVGDFILVPNKLPSIEDISKITIPQYHKGNWKKTILEIPIEDELMFFLGMYLAEGNLFLSKKHNYVINLTLNSNELSLAERMQKYLSSVLQISSKIYFREESHSLSLRMSSKGLYEFLKSSCGTGASNKHIPDIIFRVSNNFKQLFISGYYTGDGSIHTTYGKHIGSSCDVKTVSSQLAIELEYLLLMLGINGRYSEQEESIRNFGEYISHCRKVYNICYSPKSILNAKGFRGQPSKGRQIGNLSLAKITDITEITSEYSTVYDLSVKGIENFIGGLGIALHNTGEGGAVATDDEQLSKIIHSLRDWGRDCICPTGVDNTCHARFAQKFGLLPDGYDHKYVYSRLGYNMKMTDLQASLGRTQLEKLPQFIQKRRANYIYLKANLLDLQDKIHFPVILDGANPSPFGFPISIREGKGITKNRIVHLLEYHKIHTRPVFGGNLMRQPAYCEAGSMVEHPWVLDDADYIMNNTFWIGCHPSLTKPMMDYMLEVLHKVIL